MSTLLDATNDAAVTQEQPIGTDRLAVIVPVYNEERTVAELLRRLEAQPCVSQIIIVDDGSTDRTWEELEPWRSRASFTPIPAEYGCDSLSVVVIQHDRNRGKGRAIRTGLEHVTCSHVLIQDADLEYDPSDINKLWKVMQSGDADVIFGSRYLENPRLQNGRWIMQSGVRVLNLLFRLLYGIKLTDEATCYKMFRVENLRQMQLACERFEFCPEATAKAARMALRIKEVSVSYSPRSVAEGKKICFYDIIAAICILSKLWVVRPRQVDLQICGAESFVGHIPAFLSSLVLTVSATLKMTEVMRVGMAANTTGLLAVFEGVVAFLLASGTYPRVMSILTQFLFGVFALYSFVLGSLGVPACGCFGALTVSPWLAFGIDVLVLATWVSFSTVWVRRKRLSILVPWFGLLVAASLTTAAVGESAVETTAQVLTGRPATVLRPASWVGNRLPILDSTSLGTRLSLGEWIIVLHRPGCSACIALHDEYENLGIEFAAERVRKRGVAFIEVGYRDSRLSSPDRPTNDAYEIGWLDEKIDWFAPTPTVLLLRDGIVTYASEYAIVGSSTQFKKAY